MKPLLNAWIRPVPDIPVAAFWIRCFWVVVQLVAVYCLTNQASPFFYQRF